MMDIFNLDLEQLLPEKKILKYHLYYILYNNELIYIDIFNGYPDKKLILEKIWLYKKSKLKNKLLSSKLLGDKVKVKIIIYHYFHRVDSNKKYLMR